MEDLYKTLLGMEDVQARELALRLEKFIKGSLSGIFNQQSNFDIRNPFTSFNLKMLEDELRPIAMHIILDFVWTKVRRSVKKRLLILDEAWYMMRYEDSAAFIYGIAKRSRKYYLALTTATQDVQDFLSTDYGKAVLSNSSIQMLLKQSPTEIDLVAKTFYLTAGEKQMLLSANVGEGLFFAGQSHVAMRVIAAPHEHGMITSNPQEVLKRTQDQAAAAIPAEKPSITTVPVVKTNI
jgi:type IV secretory pathway VirB4 component